MSEIGAGNNSSYPGGIDTNSTPEVNSPASGKTRARKEVIEDLTAAVIAIENELGTDPAGSLTNVKTFLQLQHQTDGTHKSTHGPHFYIDEANYANFSAAVTAAANKVLIVARSINLDANTTIPSTTAIMPVNPGVINKNGFTLTINSAPVGNPMHQWLSGFAAGEVTFSVTTVEKVYAEWWQVNTNPGTTDMTTALQCALASNPPVQLFSTIYGHTGGLQLGVYSRVLQGTANRYGTIGTTLKKLSGVSDTLTVLESPYTFLRNIEFDGGSLGGRQIYTYASNALGENLSFKNQGGTSYAFHYSGNTSYYRNLSFSDGNYGNIICDTTVNGIYGFFEHITMGDTTAFQLYINGGAFLSFKNFSADNTVGSIKLTGYLQNVFFDDLSFENSTTIVAPITIDGTATTLSNVKINNIRLYATSAALLELIKVKNASSIFISNLYVLRNTTTSYKMLDLEAVNNFVLDGAEISNNTTFDFIDCYGASNYINVKNVRYQSGVGTNKYVASNISIEHSNLHQQFDATCDNVYVNNVTGNLQANAILNNYVQVNCTGSQAGASAGMRTKLGKEVILAPATGTVGFFGTTPAAQQAANADTSGATLAALETEVNELKATLRTFGLIAT